MMRLFGIRIHAKFDRFGRLWHGFRKFNKCCDADCGLFAYAKYDSGIIDPRYTRTFALYVWKIAMYVSWSMGG